MLLRSLTKHVKDQNWFAVVIDFIIVVFGVFFGLQIGERSSLRQQLSKSYILSIDYLLNPKIVLESGCVSAKR